MAGSRGKDSLGPAHKRGKRNKVVYVFTEGSVTEPQYIEVVRSKAKKVPDLEVRIANEGAPGSKRKPIKLVEAAVQLMREETRAAKRSKLAKKFWPAVWCLFDRDDHKSIPDAMKMAKAAGVGVAFSHPCFEVWRLLHHKPIEGDFGGECDMVADRLPFAKSVTDIKPVLPEQIPDGSYAKAKKWALRMNSIHGDHVPMVLREPYTNVFDFVEQGLGITHY